jgi:sulfoxide reductase heme-binding subunit YedZ
MAGAANTQVRSARELRRPPLRWLEPAVVVGALVPLADMLVRAFLGKLGANPIAEALNHLGLLAFILLIASLACTPLKLLFGVVWPMRLRRALGLLSFTYACLHFLVYVLLDRRGASDTLLADVLERPFILVGTLAFVLLIPLAATSTKASVKRLGAARWRSLHRLAYVAAGLAALHFIFRVKRDLSEPLTYAVLLGLLLVVRFTHAKPKSPTPKR